MNVPPVDSHVQFRALRSRNIPYDMRNRPNDKQTSKRQKPDIHRRSSSLKIHSKMTPEISQGQPNIPDKTISNTSKTGQ